MNDALGQPLVVGDHVAFVPANSSYIDIGIVLGFTAQNIRVRKTNSVNVKGSLRDPFVVVKINEQYKDFIAKFPEAFI